MQALIELLAGFIALLATAALAQFGVNLDKVGHPEREVRRVSDCHQAQPSTLITVKRASDC